MNAAGLSSRFDDDYWTNASVYSKYDDYDEALVELRGFNRGLVRRVVRRRHAVVVTSMRVVVMERSCSSCWPWAGTRMGSTLQNG